MKPKSHDSTAAHSPQTSTSVNPAATCTTTPTKRTFTRAGSRIGTCETASEMLVILFFLSCTGALFVWPGDSFGAVTVASDQSEPLILELFRAVLVALATWAALKVEIAAARITAANAKESADEAHKRIDIHLQEKHRP